MIKKRIVYILFPGLLFFFTNAHAQIEELINPEVNTLQYYASKPQQNSDRHKYLIDQSSIIVKTDTLSLPFVDDFSKNTLRGYRAIEKSMTDTFENVIGTCLAVEGISTITGRFMTAASWTYSYDTVTHTIDSVVQAPIPFTFFGPAPSGCFAQAPQTISYWPEYYRYTFDSTGNKIDSALVAQPADTFDYAPVIYFATAEPGKLWFDNYAYHNYTYPVNPPTLGVATLDGLNEFGLPYNNSGVNTYGDADVLTSLPINMAGLDTSQHVFFSFFYEGQGLGDYPDSEDSLFLEFKDNSGQWRILWSDTGYSSSQYVPQSFKQVLIQVPALPVPYNYFHNTFQFRFRNKASLYGNNDHWHIDYVRLDKNRSEGDTIIQDIAFIYQYPNILKNYTYIPADQFIFPDEVRDTVVIPVHNLDPNANNNPPATNFTTGAEQLYLSPVVLAPGVLQTFNAGEYSNLNVFPSTDYNYTNTTPQDSIVWVSKIFISPNDFRRANDTILRTTQMSYMMGYDDGSAERSYGISGLGIKKFAYEFELNYPDTLAGFMVHFTQVDDNVSNLIFNFYAWDSLSLNNLNFVESPLFSLENQKPKYVDSVNGFATYKLDTPIIVSNKVYIGWSQTDDRRLQIGYDLNSTLGRQHMYYFANSVWKPSTISPAGSPMIRLILDTDFWGGSTSIKDLTQNKSLWSVYPNPARTSLFIDGISSDVVNVEVYNLMGQKVAEFQNITQSIPVQQLLSGVYILQLQSKRNSHIERFKMVKADN